MVWSAQHDVMLCREILLAQPFQHKFGSRERGHAWDEVADRLSKISEPKFLVDQRAVRERYSKLEKGFKRKMAMEERASGISPQMTEVDQAIETIIGLAESAKEELAKAEGEKNQVKEKEKETAEGVRKRAMERLGETKDRENGGRVKKRRVYSGVETIALLHDKGEMEVKLRQQEIDLKKRELELRELEISKLSDERSFEREMRAREEASREQKWRLLLETQQQIICMMQQLMQQMKEQNSVLVSLMSKVNDKI